MSCVTLMCENGDFNPEIDIYNLLEKILPTGITLVAKASTPKRDCMSFKQTLFFLIIKYNCILICSIFHSGNLNSILTIVIPKKFGQVEGQEVCSNGTPNWLQTSKKDFRRKRI